MASSSEPPLEDLRVGLDVGDQVWINGQRYLVAQADPAPTATVYLLGTDLAVDCDACHASLVGSPVVAVGSAWLAEAIAAHARSCPGGPL